VKHLADLSTRLNKGFATRSSQFCLSVCPYERWDLGNYKS